MSVPTLSVMCVPNRAASLQVSSLQPTTAMPGVRMIVSLILHIHKVFQLLPRIPPSLLPQDKMCLSTR